MNVRDLILEHEGEVLHAYEDSRGYLTIGVGRLIDRRLGGGISHDESMFLLDNDIAKAREECGTFPWFSALDEVRQAAMIDLTFNLGLTRLRRFVRFLAAMAVSDWPLAADELLDSNWFKQVARRGPRIVGMIDSGQWPLTGD